MTHILLVDDDIDLTDLLSEYLRAEGFEVAVVNDGLAAVDKIKLESFDLMVLDVMMPKMNGFDTLREVRKVTRLPVLMLTARGDDIDRIVGLEMGADDYLPKPANPRELLARIRAILRRSESRGAIANPLASMAIDDVALQPSTRQVKVDGQEIELTSTEFNVLAELMKHAGHVVSKNELSQNVLDRKLMQHDRSMDMHVSNLRKKLGECRLGNPRIKTVRGIGYIYVLGAEGVSST